MGVYIPSTSYKLTPLNKLCLTLMISALNVLALYAGASFTWFLLPAYLLTGAFGTMLAYEKMFLHTLLALILTTGISLLIISTRTYILPYFTLLSVYPYIKQAIFRRLPDLFLRFFIKLLICNLLIGGAYALSLFVLGVDPLSELSDIPLYAIILVLEALFVLLDGVTTLFTRVYDTFLRKALFS